MEENIFSAQINGFTIFLEKEEYRPSTIKRYSNQLIDYLDWAARSTKTQAKKVEESILLYLDTSIPIQTRGKDIKTVRAALHQYYKYLTGEKFQPKGKPELNYSIETELNRYDQYLKEVVGLADVTREGYRKHLKRFLCFIFKDQDIDPSAITAPGLKRYLIEELGHLKPVSKQTALVRIKSYIRYLKFKGHGPHPSLTALSFSAPVWKLSGVPRTFGADEIKRICSSYDLNTETGIRDHAIFLCFTELGLRAAEVANMSLEDFNWHAGTLLIRKTKTYRERILPLSKQVGEAIYGYLKKARPKTDNRILFVRFARLRGEAMGREQIRGTVRRAYARAGISPEITGTHILRHSKAKHMYENGSSLKVIADVLGHESIDTSAIYTKVGRSKLGCVTCPWIEVDHEQ